MSKPDVDYLFVLDLDRGLVWRLSSVTEEPEVQLTNWDVKKDTEGCCYFVGARADDGWIRVSTAIVEFDPERRRGRTQSGRVYELVGQEGLSAKGELLWSSYKITHGIEEAKECS